MQDSVLLQLKKQSNKTQGFSSNPIKSSLIDDEVFNRITNSITNIAVLLDNTKVDKIVKDEFGKDYPMISVLVKERLFVIGF